MDDTRQLVALTTQVVASYVSRNSISASAVSDLVRTIHHALEGVSQPAAAEPPAEPLRATGHSIRRSITPEALISFIDGKAYKTLKRHLTTHGLTVEAYKARYGLPPDYPMTAANASLRRSEIAKAHGLGRGGARGSPSPEAKPARQVKA